jgi:hypothetical protein
LTKKSFCIIQIDFFDLIFHLKSLSEHSGKIPVLVKNQGTFTLKRSIFTISKMDHQLLRQKVCQRISVMKTNNGVFVVFKTKFELKYQFSGITEIL